MTEILQGAREHFDWPYRMASFQRYHIFGILVLQIQRHLLDIGEMSYKGRGTLEMYNDIGGFFRLCSSS